MIRPLVHNEMSAEPRLFTYFSGLAGDPADKSAKLFAPVGLFPSWFTKTRPDSPADGTRYNVVSRARNEFPTSLRGMSCFDVRQTVLSPVSPHSHSFLLPCRPFDLRIEIKPRSACGARPIQRTFLNPTPRYSTSVASIETTFRETSGPLVRVEPKRICGGGCYEVGWTR